MLTCLVLNDPLKVELRAEKILKLSSLEFWNFIRGDFSTTEEGLLFNIIIMKHRFSIEARSEESER